MEPDQLKTLREKINTLERQPVSWQKEFVWKQVAHKTNHRPFTIRWSYAAALVLTGVIGYSILFYQQRVWESAAMRISSLEKQIQSEKNKIAANQNNEEEKCVTEKTKSTLRASSLNKTKNSILVEESPVYVQESLAINTNDSTIISAITSESVVSIEMSPPIKTIAPIIGRIPQSIADRPGKQQTVRIRLNKKDNSELTSPQEEWHVLVARIN
jgi:hypothetical protein